MRKITLFTIEELEALAIEQVRNVGREYSYKRWELEISTDKYPRLWVYYVNNTQEFCKVVQLEIPK